jgi:F0F1-type ATP synthase assembly protein I
MNRYIEIEQDSELIIAATFIAGLFIGIVVGLLVGDWVVLI